ncbi:MAG: SpoIID/LytB domain-containing protein [Elusimicrobiales bacterium]
MNPLPLLLLLAALPAAAAARTADIRIYSLHKITSINLEPAGDAFLDGHRLGKSRVAVRGALVALEGRPKPVSAKVLKVRAGGAGVWLSGPGLPRRLYAGELSFSASRGRLKIINTVPLETYLAGVVSAEASDLSHPEAFKAQAVAARTYTLKHYRAHSGEGYSLCDSTHCQYYTGAAGVSARARAAVEATSGELLVYKGAPAETYYHSVCGGRTETMTYVWPHAHKPYLVSVKDGPVGRPYCAIAPRFYWKTKIYFTGLTRLGRQAGWLVSDEEARGLRVSARGASGRAAELEIYTQRRRVKVQATEFYHGIGRRAGWNAVRSTNFRLIQGGDHVLLDGKGNGHGVGLCQWGAEGMARKGFKYRDILRHYYPGTEIGHD